MGAALCKEGKAQSRSDAARGGGKEEQGDAGRCSGKDARGTQLEGSYIHNLKIIVNAAQVYLNFLLVDLVDQHMQRRSQLKKIVRILFILIVKREAIFQLAINLFILTVLLIFYLKILIIA